MAWEVRQDNSKSVAHFDQLVAKSTVNSDRKLSKFQCKSAMAADTAVNNERGHIWGLLRSIPLKHMEVQVLRLFNLRHLKSCLGDFLHMGRQASEESG